MQPFKTIHPGSKLGRSDSLCEHGEERRESGFEPHLCEDSRMDGLV